MKLDFGNGFSLSLWQDEIKALEVQDGQIILTTPTGRIITLKIPNINPKDPGISRLKTLETLVPHQEATEPPSPTSSTRSTICSENLASPVKKDIDMDMIEKIRKEIENFKQDVAGRYQELRHTYSSLGERQKRVEEGNIETKSKLKTHDERLNVIDSQMSPKLDNIMTMVHGMVAALKPTGTGEPPILEDRTKKRKGKGRLNE